MQNLTPELVFLYTFCAASLSGLAVLLRSGSELNTRNVLGAILFHGSAGVGLGMIAFDWLGGKQAPWKVIACGWLVGLRIIKLSDIAEVVRRILNVNSEKDDDKNKK
jgi:hypothetical protein